MNPSYTDEFFFDAINTFKDRKTDKDLSRVTKALYINNLKWLLTLIDKPKNKNILWVMTHPTDVFHLISHSLNTKTKKPLSPSTILSFLSTFLSIFSHIPDVKVKYPQHCEKYKEYFTQTNSGILKENASGIFSEKQENGYVEWSEIIKKRDELAKTEYASKSHLILALYTYIPPLRQDFGLVKILKEEPAIDEGNYMVINKNSVTLVLNAYKTHKAFPQYRKDLPKPLADIIVKSLKNKPRQYLFVNNVGQPYKDKRRYIENINDTIFRIFGVHLTPTLIRHAETIYERTLNLSPAQEEQLAKDMRHSLTVHNRYRLAESYHENLNPNKHEDPAGDIFSML
jgi:hypothetical protein